MKRIHTRRLAAVAVVAALAAVVPATASSAVPVVTDYDYTGDGRADFSVDRLESSTFFWAGGSAANVGAPGAIPVPANWHASTPATEPATFDDTTGVWTVPATGQSFGFGRRDDVPVVGNWTGEADADAAVFRPSTGTWYVRGLGSFGFGRSTDIAMAFDANGDGGVDAALFRPSTGQWFVRNAGGTVTVTAFGRSGDVPVPADYDGDGDADLTVFRPSSGQWFSKAITGLVGFGRFGDVPVPADYDGDGDADVAVWRASTSTWYVRGGESKTYGRAITDARGVQDLPARRDLLSVLY